MQKFVKKILIADDQKNILEILKILFEAKGYEVITLPYGKKVLQTALLVSPDVILLDVYLEDSDGIEICGHLKTMPETRHIPVVMMSAHTNAEAILKDCAADAFVAKPFNIADLTSAIELQLG